MDLQKCLVTLCSVFLGCVIAAGLAHAQWRESFDASINNLQMGDSSDERQFQPYSYDTDSDDPFFGNMLSNLLKRNVFANNYRRLPRIKQQRIIPFYSYGNDLLRFRSMPRGRYGGRMRSQYVYKPWNAETYRPSKYLNRKVYSSYGLK